MRKGAADVYARHVAHPTVGRQARAFLLQFLGDSSEPVRTAATHAFHDLKMLSTDDQASLLSAFLETNPTGKTLDPLLRALNDSPVELPDLVCTIAETCIADWNRHSGERTWSAYQFLPAIVLRLYAQKIGEDIRSRCLNLIDDMERHQLYRFYEELRKAER